MQKKWFVHPKCPVITIKGKDHIEGCDNIILPLDLEKETKEKVSYTRICQVLGCYCSYCISCVKR